MLLACADRGFCAHAKQFAAARVRYVHAFGPVAGVDRKSTRLNSSHGYISYAVFCLKKKKRANKRLQPRPQSRGLNKKERRESRGPHHRLCSVLCVRRRLLCVVSVFFF